jgi:putative selenate reductase
VALDYVAYRVESGRVVEAGGGRLEVREHHQIGNFQDFCNDCGNCDVFCPESGGPYLVKPRFFGSLDAWRAQKDRDGFFVDRRDGRTAMWGRLRGVEYRLDVDAERDLAAFSDGRVTLELAYRSRSFRGASAAPDAPDGHTLDGRAVLEMAVLLDGVLDPRRANPVNAALPAQAPLRLTTTP